MSRKSMPLTDHEGEVREIGAADMAAFKPAAETLPAPLYAALTAPRKGRGANKAPTKTQVTVRLDQDVLLALKAGGKGWQTRLNDTLRRALLPK